MAGVAEIRGRGRPHTQTGAASCTLACADCWITDRRARRIGRPDVRTKLGAGGWWANAPAARVSLPTPAGTSPSGHKRRSNGTAPPDSCRSSKASVCSGQCLRHAFVGTRACYVRCAGGLVPPRARRRPTARRRACSRARGRHHQPRASSRKQPERRQLMRQLMDLGVQRRCAPTAIRPRGTSCEGVQVRQGSLCRSLRTS